MSHPIHQLCGQLCNVVAAEESRQFTLDTHTQYYDEFSSSIEHQAGWLRRFTS
jgi:hypothetical protein